MHYLQKNLGILDTKHKIYVLRFPGIWCCDLYSQFLISSGILSHRGIANLNKQSAALSQLVIIESR